MDRVELQWLEGLITGDSTPAVGTVLESWPVGEAANPFFAHWMVTWSRKLSIARSLGRIATELQASSRRTALAQRTSPSLRGRSLESRELRSVDRFKLQRAFIEVDIFPRCALLLRIFEGLSPDDTATLLGVDKELVAYAQSVGLLELSRIMSGEQGHWWLPAAAGRCGPHELPSTADRKNSNRLLSKVRDGFPVAALTSYVPGVWAQADGSRLAAQKTHT